jgi:hypothetical protein
MRIASDSITYLFRVDGISSELRLMIRRDAEGNLWLSIV